MHHGFRCSLWILGDGHGGGADVVDGRCTGNHVFVKGQDTTVPDSWKSSSFWWKSIWIILINPTLTCLLLEIFIVWLSFKQGTSRTLCVLFLGTIQSARNFSHWKVKSVLGFGFLQAFTALSCVFFWHFCWTCCTKRWDACLICAKWKVIQKWASRSK
jgi:hypothetical protein